ncbi:Bcr/CflA family multidrug efflux MFS transporter [Pleomorphomonas oryzae]|uniref:Bcr/CflA family multidrug efflux MFS transporter n=1 Tax=Pleomorphomonas oryzae TaxID=261934 RepID=UPI0004217954|nr:Bcr/CflA family multidrug efflux MFS transporter [Pleomorphomonas oryzae]
MPDFGEPETAGRRTRAADILLLVVLGALMAFASISTDTYLPAFPVIAADFGVTEGRIQLTISSYLIGFSLGQLVWGPISDRVGRRGPIIWGLGLFMAVSIGCALSDSAEALILWRLMQALGASAGPVLARAMVRDLYARERAAEMLSTLMLIMAVAPLIGPIVGGQILLVGSWRAIFWCLTAVGALSVAGVILIDETLPDDRRGGGRLAGVWKSYGRVLADRRLIVYAASGGFYYGGAFAYIAGTPFAYIDYYKVPAAAYGLLFAVNVIGLMAANFANARMVARLGSDRILRFGAAVAALSGVTLAIDAWLGLGGLWGLTIPLFFYFSASGLIVANSVAGALAAFPREAGAASAVLGAVHYGAGIFSATLLGWISDGTPWPMGVVIGAGGVLSLVASLMMRKA